MDSVSFGSAEPRTITTPIDDNSTFSLHHASMEDHDFGQLNSTDENTEFVKVIMYIQFVLFCFGIFGNLATIIVLSRPALRKLNTSVYLNCLAFFDSSAIVCDIVPRVLEYFTSVNAFTYILQNMWVCRGFYFLGQSFFLHKFVVACISNMQRIYCNNYATHR
mgnify:CR=1 FL=1